MGRSRHACQEMPVEFSKELLCTIPLHGSVGPVDLDSSRPVNPWECCGIKIWIYSPSQLVKPETTMTKRNLLENIDWASSLGLRDVHPKGQ